MVVNVLDRKTIFTPIFRMDDKKAFNEDFDEMIDGIIHKMNNAKKYEAREVIFELKKRWRNLFELNEEEFKAEQEELRKKSESTTNKEAANFKRLLDSILPETEQPLSFNSDSWSTFKDFTNAIKGMKTNVKLCTRGSLHNFLDIASLLELSNVKLRRRYSDVLKECGYSKSYGSFMLRLLYLSRNYPDLRRVSTPTQYIQTNMKIIEENIFKYFTSPFQCHQPNSQESTDTDRIPGN